MDICIIGLMKGSQIKWPHTGVNNASASPVQGQGHILITIYQVYQSVTVTTINFWQLYTPVSKCLGINVNESKPPRESCTGFIPNICINP